MCQKQLADEEDARDVRVEELGELADVAGGLNVVNAQRANSRDVGMFSVVLCFAF